MSRATLVAVLILSVPAARAAQQPRDSASCQSDIVSSTVVATFCGHPDGDNEMLDLLILWRGRPGWFQWKGTGSRGSAGSGHSGGGTKGVVSRSPELVRNLRCDIPMPAPPPVAQVPVMTVCDRLKRE